MRLIHYLTFVLILLSIVHTIIDIALNKDYLGWVFSLSGWILVAILEHRYEWGKR